VSERTIATYLVSLAFVVLLASTTTACKRKRGADEAGASPTDSAARALEDAHRATDARLAKEKEEAETTRVALGTLGARYVGILAAMDKAVKTAPPCTSKSGDANATAMIVDEQFVTLKGTGSYLGLLSPTQRKAWYTPFEEKDRNKRDWDAAKARSAAEACAGLRWLVVARITDHVAPAVTGDKKFRPGTMGATAVLFDDTKPVCRVVASARNAPDVNVITFGAVAGLPEARLENDLERQLRKAIEKKMVDSKSLASLDPLE
jgi:hypothetical protein